MLATDLSEINEIPPQQKPQGKRKYVRSGKHIGKNSKAATPHVSEEQTMFQDQKASVKGLEQDKTDDCDAAGNIKPLGKAVPETRETPPPKVASPSGPRRS